MNRRSFSAGLALSGLMAARPAQATIRARDGSEGMPSAGFIWIDSRGRASIGVPSRIIILSDHFRREIGVNFKLPLQNEKRAGILNPTLQSQFRRRVAVGDARISGRTIYIQATVPPSVAEIRLSDFDISFRINVAKLGRPYTGGVPALNDLPVLGSLFRRAADRRMQRNLLLLLRPELLHYAE